LSEQRIGPYQLLREIGRSNHVVYEATDTRANTRVALKVLDLPLSLQGVERAQQVERFQREVRASMRMDHPNIVRTLEAGQDQGRLFVAMEFLEGESLTDLLRARGALSLQEALPIIRQTCAALTYAHLRGVVHRDIKPGNVIILPDGRVKLTDFGIARIIGDPRMTTEGQTVGTPYYMSPEQISGAEVTSASDIFSVGVLVYELLSGRKPFAGSNVAEITKAVLQTEPAYPPPLPPQTVNALRKAMAKYPPGRFATAEEFANALAGASRFSPTAAATPGAMDAYSSAYAPPCPEPPGAAPPPLPAYLSQPLAPQSSQLLLPLVVAGIVALVVIIAGPRTYGRYRFDVRVRDAYQELVRAQSLVSQEEYDAALTHCRMAVESAPPGSPAAKQARAFLYGTLVLAANYYLKSGRAREAATQASEAVQLEPSKSEGWLVLGIAQHRNGDSESALATLDKGVALAANASAAQQAREAQALVHYEMALSLMRQKEIGLAATHLQAAIEAAPSSDTAERARQTLNRLYSMPPPPPPRVPPTFNP
jgi:tetratricopeptide (TPR) repeat protein